MCFFGWIFILADFFVFLQRKMPEMKKRQERLQSPVEVMYKKGNFSLITIWKYCTIMINNLTLL